MMKGNFLFFWKLNTGLLEGNVERKWCKIDANKITHGEKLNRKFHLKETLGRNDKLFND